VLLLTRANGPALVARTPAAAHASGNRKPRAKPDGGRNPLQFMSDPAPFECSSGPGKPRLIQNQSRCTKISQPLRWILITSVTIGQPLEKIDGSIRERRPQRRDGLAANS